MKKSTKRKPAAKKTGKKMPMFMMSEPGEGESFPSKGAMKKHEKGEGKKKEKKEKMMGKKKRGGKKK